ncbi:hypothetical protein YC2023_083602 [Brassica napus]
MGKDAKAGGKGKGKQASGSDEAPPRGKENQERLLMRDMYYAKSKERSTIAAEYLEGPSGKKGGDLGWFPRDKMAGPFQDVAVNTPAQIPYHLPRRKEELTDYLLLCSGSALVELTC